MSGVSPHLECRPVCVLYPAASRTAHCRVSAGGGEGEGLKVDRLPLFVILSATKTSCLLSTESDFCVVKFKTNPSSPFDANMRLIVSMMLLQPDLHINRVR